MTEGQNHSLETVELLLRVAPGAFGLAILGIVATMWSGNYPSGVFLFSALGVGVLWFSSNYAALRLPSSIGLFILGLGSIVVLYALLAVPQRLSSAPNVQVLREIQFVLTGVAVYFGLLWVLRSHLRKIARQRFVP